MNNKEIQEFWLKNGYYNEQILSDEEVELYREETRKLFKEKPTSPYKNPTEDSELLIDLMKHPRVLELVSICMEADLGIQNVKVDALQTWMYLKPPGELGRDIHQNIFYTHANRGDIINTSIALNDADKENGGLFVYPGSQHEWCLPITVDEDRMRTNPIGWNNERGKPCVLPGEWVNGEWKDKYEKVYTNAKAGSVSLIHSHVIHGSEENTSPDRWRTAFLTAYLRQGAHFIQGNDMKRKKIAVYD